MARTFDLFLSLVTSQPSTLPSTQPAVELPTGAIEFQTTLVAIGLCVLFVWVVRRLANLHKLRLTLAPHRPNTLELAHVLGLLLLILLLDSAANLLTMAAFGRPAEDTIPYAKAVVLSIFVVRLVEIAVVLYLAQRTFRFGLVNGLGLSMRHWVFDTGRGVFLLLAIYPVCALLSIVSQKILPDAVNRIHPILAFLHMEDVSGGWKFMAIATAALVAPVFEELLFRGILQSALRQHLRRPWLAIGIVSVFFAAIHVNAGTLKGLPDMPPLIALSMALGYSYERCGRLWPSILMHMLFNTITLTLVLWA